SYFVPANAGIFACDAITSKDKKLTVLSRDLFSFAEFHRVMLSETAQPSRASQLIQVAKLLVAVLFVKVLLAIVYEYRWYFPANFDATFLLGRESSFTGLYATAFYTHIISGPLTVLLGTFLMWSGARMRFPLLHRWAGRLQVLLIFIALVPSGLMMARQTLAGPIAGYGFTALALATAFSASAMLYYAVTKRFALHQQWASRCYVLLLSPLLLRISGGGFVVLQWESAWTYRLNAWCSWLLPLVMLEIYRCYLQRGEPAVPRRTRLLFRKESLS
ncbi:MAG TPA: DUF2306 domain-containing protein, partial [Pirellulaceae bacterium]|nr:DUF2306 domain-containing protein [Pirellulaceae bacterium]